MHKDISEKIIGKIKKEKIIPKPKVFDYKSFLFWFIFSFLIILGGMAVSLILISIFVFGKENFQYASGGFLKILFISIPYLWIILFSLFAYFGLKAFRSTNKGYRQNFTLILLVIFLASFSLGALFHIIGINRIMHQMIVNRVPFYNRLAPTEEGQWSRPGMGMVGGEIIKIGEDFFVVQDFRSKKIMVIYSEESIIDENVNLKKGEKVRVMGEMVDRKTFKARVIHSWEGEMLPPKEERGLRNFRMNRVN